MRKRIALSCVAVCAFALLAATSAFAGDAWLGSWKLNVAKSKYPSETSLRAQALKFEAAAGGAIKLTMEGTDPQGKPLQGGYTAKFDGTDAPWPGNPVADTAAPKRIDDHSYANVWKKGGKPVLNAKVEVSKDGKTLTVTQSPLDGSPGSVGVYDRQ